MAQKQGVAFVPRPAHRPSSAGHVAGLTPGPPPDPPPGAARPVDHAPPPPAQIRSTPAEPAMELASIGTSSGSYPDISSGSATEGAHRTETPTLPNGGVGSYGYGGSSSSGSRGGGSIMHDGRASHDASFHHHHHHGRQDTGWEFYLLSCSIFPPSREGVKFTSRISPARWSCGSVSSS